MKKKEPDIFDLLEPTRITIKEFESKTIPFQRIEWIDSSDLTIQEIAKLLPHQLSFIYSLLHEYPELLPAETHVPGRIQELIFRDIMQNLESRTKRDLSLESKITRLWVEHGGIAPKKQTKEQSNG